MHLLWKHRRALTAYIQLIVRDHHLAEDTFQDVAMVLMRRWEEFGEVKGFWPLAREIARRQALAALRKQGRQAASLSPDVLDSVLRCCGPETDPDETRREALRDCVQALPPRWRRIVNLRYGDNLSLREVAQRLRGSENSIAVTLNRIRARLAESVSRRLKALEARVA